MYYCDGTNEVNARFTLHPILVFLAHRLPVDVTGFGTRVDVLFDRALESKVLDCENLWIELHLAYGA